MRRVLAASVVVAVLAAGAVVALSRGPRTPAPRDAALAFGVIGDTPYSPFEADRLDEMIRHMRSEHLAFVVHVGDVKAGSSPCPDEVYDQTLRRFGAFGVPVVYTPGDNDWMDCGRTGSDPLERLAHVRALFFKDRPLGLVRQARFPENARFASGGLVFATLHVVGGSNNIDQRSEYRRRNAADVEWMRSSFADARARHARAIVLAMQADPWFEREPGKRPGFEDIVNALVQECARFDGRVIVLHGDTHRMRIDKPLPGSPNLTRVETYGSPDVGWIRGTVDDRGAIGFVPVPAR